MVYIQLRDGPTGQGVRISEVRDSQGRRLRIAAYKVAHGRPVSVAEPMDQDVDAARAILALHGRLADLPHSVDLRSRAKQVLEGIFPEVPVPACEKVTFGEWQYHYPEPDSWERFVEALLTE